MKIIYIVSVLSIRMFFIKEEDMVSFSDFEFLIEEYSKLFYAF